MPQTLELIEAGVVDPSQSEELNVHAVYEAIAPHFSQTRYKPWPIVEQFLSSLPVGSVGLDSGTGNGKYLSCPAHRPRDIMTVGLDRSPGLLQFARSAGGTLREVLIGDAMQLYWRQGIFDYAISIATIHHLSTHSRRRNAVQALLHAVSPSRGRLLIYVWASEQESNSKRELPISISDPSQGIDALVPWVLSDQTKGRGVEPQVYKRYYHFFAPGELRRLVTEAALELDLVVDSPSTSGSSKRKGLQFVRDGYEKSNFYVEIQMWER